MEEKGVEMPFLNVYDDNNVTKSTSDYMDEIVQNSKNEVFLRGSFLADCLNEITLDYRLRRNRMPKSAERMLDGLWVVAQDWALNRENIDFSKNSWIVYGIDESEKISFAVWTDNEGRKASRVYNYNPWPTGRWEVNPSYEFLQDIAINNGNRTLKNNKLEAILLDDFDISQIIWKCNL